VGGFLAGTIVFSIGYFWLGASSTVPLFLGSNIGYWAPTRFGLWASVHQPIRWLASPTAEANLVRLFRDGN
jgi:hypothetical protein